MITTVNLLHEPTRRRPHIVRWWGEPDPETGKQRRYGRSFVSAIEARKFFVEKQSEMDRGKPRDPVDASIEELFAEFEEARLSVLSYASKIGYRLTMRQMLGYFGHRRKVRHIQRRHAEAFVATRKRCDGRSGELSMWAKARHLIHCRAIFAAAIEWGYTEDNPFRATRYGGNSPLRIRPKGRPWHHITPEQFMQLLAVVPSARQRAALWFMYGCGLRPGEVYNLMVANVDLERRRVHVVNRAATPTVPPFTVKAEGQSTESKERSVPIPNAAIPDIAEAMKSAFKSGGFLTLTPRRYERVQEHWRLCQANEGWSGHTWRPWQNRDMLNNLLRDTKKFLQRADMALSAPFTLQTFRKSFAQNHADAGTPPRTLAKLLGHANTRVTMQYYNRVTDANERAADDAMNRLLSQNRRVTTA